MITGWYQNTQAMVQQSNQWLRPGYWLFAAWYTHIWPLCTWCHMRGPTHSQSLHQHHVNTVDISPHHVSAMQGYKCYCQPCVPTPQHAARRTAGAGVGVAALTVILFVSVLVLIATGVLAYKLQQEVKMPPVSVYTYPTPVTSRCLLLYSCSALFE